MGFLRKEDTHLLDLVGNLIGQVHELQSSLQRLKDEVRQLERDYKLLHVQVIAAREHGAKES